MKHGNYIYHGFDPVSLVINAQKHKGPDGGPSRSIATSVATLIKEDGATIDDLDAQSPGYVLMNKRKLEEYIAWQKVKKAALSKQPWIPPKHKEGEDCASANWRIRQWVLENIRQPRAFKQRQLYIWSEGPNAGKTHLVNELRKMLITYNMPRTNFIDGYESGRYDLVVFDEFSSDHTLLFLNEFLQGSEQHLNQKGSGCIKTDNPPMIFLANRPPEEVYSRRQGTGPFTAFMSRLIVIKIPPGSCIDIFNTLE